MTHRKSGINDVRRACFGAWARGDADAARVLNAEYGRLIAVARKRSKPMSHVTKARRGHFARNCW